MKANAVRLQLHALAYNLANFFRTLVLPDEVERWSLTTLREKVVKIGAKVIAHARYTVFQMAEVAVPRDLFRRILDADRRPPTKADRAMLSLAAEAVTVEPDGRGAPDASLDGRKWRCRAGATGDRGRFRQETGLLMLFRDGPQGYSSLGGPLARLRSGECRLIS